jgi:hypothetical protein
MMLFYRNIYDISIESGANHTQLVMDILACHLKQNKYIKQINVMEKVFVNIVSIMCEDYLSPFSCYPWSVNQHFMAELMSFVKANSKKCVCVYIFITSNINK